MPDDGKFKIPHPAGVTMRIFVYEAITAGAGWAHEAESSPSEGLLAEGLAMLRAVTEDFAAIQGMEVCGLRNARLPDFHLPRKDAVIYSVEEERGKFQWLANSCDWVLVIAPELDGMLKERVEWLKGTKAKLLSPSDEFLAIAASKTKTAERLRKRGVPVPRATDTSAGPIPFPLVLKRDDGAGSVGMRLIRNMDELVAAGISIPPSAISAPPRDASFEDRSLTQRRKGRREEKEYRLEEFCPGLPASVAVLCGPAGNVSLQPCEQRLDDVTFEYLGGSTPLSPALEGRAKRLALAAIGAMPPTVGYVGVDLVLGEPADGSRDVVIEINPRLTTSYVGLRQVCQQNLAQAMLDVAAGKLVELSFRVERVEFQANGKSSPLTP